jgi:4'-phosphopantetheinyl transferase EntD
LTKVDEVADGVWLGRFYPVRPRRVAAATRHSTDRAAARRALLAIRSAEVCGFAGGACSFSHTEGVGAALLGARGRRLGVDVVRIERVNARHAAAVLSPGEWIGRRVAPRLRPALAWAVKEAAAKATGDPLSFFPCGLRVAADDRVVVVAVGDPLDLELSGGWDADGDYLWAWVFG